MWYLLQLMFLLLMVKVVQGKLKVNVPTRECEIPLAGISDCSPIFIFPKNPVCVPQELQIQQHMTMTCEDGCDIRGATHNFWMRRCVYPIFIGDVSWVGRILKLMLSKKQIKVASYIQAYYMNKLPAQPSIFKKFLNAVFIRNQGPGKEVLFHTYKWDKFHLLSLNVNDIKACNMSLNYVLKRSKGHSYQRAFTFTYMNIPPNCFVYPNNKPKGGTAMDSAKLIADRMKLDVKYIFSPIWGSFRNGTWTGMISDLVEGRADMSSCGIISSEIRRKFVDFVLELESINFLWASPLPKPLQSYTSVIHPFNHSVWVGFVCSIVIVALALKILASLSSRLHHVEYHYSRFTNSLSLCLAYLGKSTVNVIPQGSSSRVVTAAWALSCVIFVYSYSGSLTSFLTTAKTSKPIITPEQAVLSKSTRKITHPAYKWTFIGELFEATTDPWLQKLYSEFEPGDSFTNFKAISEGKDALLFLADNYLHDFHRRLYGNNTYSRVSFSNTIFQSFPSFGLQKDSKYEYEVNVWASRIREHGFAVKFANDYIRRSKHHRHESTVHVLGLVHFKSPLLLLGMGIVAGFFRLVIEKMSAKILTKKEQVDAGEGEAS